jgi:hypothetical protein
MYQFHCIASYDSLAVSNYKVTQERKTIVCVNSK